MSSHTNRLSKETSPYLLQHAHNPVDWHAWNDEALNLARKEDRPIFLSVGYSSCYWCHVMERQSFENESIAAEMNQRFINIKVDREERPDIDQLYMTAIQLLTRQGGWPMSVFLTPDLRPFFGGTYFPPTDSYGRPGFPKVITAIDEAYRTRRQEINASADQLVAILRQMSRPRRPENEIRIDLPWLKDLIDRTAADFDEHNGGFGAAPKFPRQTLLELILIYLRQTPDPDLMRMLKSSLDAMAYGGIRDHLGGGFHRYSTDDRWLVPHFEIMLYDNAMLLWIYAEAHRQTSEPRYAAIARGIADFILREMTSPAGAFFTALDAEVDAQEGGSYLWTREEAAETLAGKIPATDADKFLRAYGLDDGPNFADPHHGNGMPDKNVLYLADPGNGEALTDQSLEQSRQILLAARRQRKQPMLDTKILTSWNALMIRALAHAGEILNEEKYTQAAEKAADFLLANHRDSEGGLLRVSAGQTARHRAFLDDYAFLIQSLLTLPNKNRRSQANELTTIMRNRFSAGPEGGFFYTDDRATDLIVRQMVATDSPLPSGNAIAAMALLELGDWQTARSTITAFAGQLETVGEGMSALAEAALLYIRQHSSLEIIPSADPIRPQSPAELAANIVSVTPAWEGRSLLHLKCRIQEGFHLNSHDAKSAPTRLIAPAAKVDSMEYPPGELKNEFEILVRFKSPIEGKIELALTYQPCDASACLPITTQKLAIIAPN